MYFFFSDRGPEVSPLLDLLYLEQFDSMFIAERLDEPDVTCFRTVLGQ